MRLQLCLGLLVAFTARMGLAQSAEPSSAKPAGIQEPSGQAAPVSPALESLPVPKASPAPAAGTTKAPASPLSEAMASNAMPSDPKAIKTFLDAQKLARSRQQVFALDGFRKADKQDGGHCLACEYQAYKVASQEGNFKAAHEEAALLLEHLTSPADKFQAHYLAGSACLAEGMQNSHDKDFQDAENEFKAALQIAPKSQHCLYGDALALAHLKQDGQAREQFQAFLKVTPSTDVDYVRAQRFAEHPEMARARTAPNFRVTTLDGRTLTLEDFQGKVVLIDFWATWCGPCRNALPHVRSIAQRFQGQPLIVLSVSLDRDDAKWKDFIAHNQMTWVQYRDTGGNDGLARLFGVTSIPATFTIDADGVLQDQHVGDADIDGKIKKLVMRAAEISNRKTVAGTR